MSDQHFENVESVTQTGDVIHIHPPGTVPALGELQWISKSFPFGRMLRAKTLSGIVVVASLGPFLLYIPFSLKLTAWLPISKDEQGAVSTIILAVLMGFVLCGLHLGGRLARVSESGFAPFGDKLCGYLKEVNGSVSRVELGGSGTVCANQKCRGRLKFVTVVSATLLQCERNSIHRWQFDHTAVGDG